MDYYEIDADKANEYISHLDGVKAFAGGSKEEQLEQIITQKWIAVFPNGNEGWAEVRRTGLSALSAGSGQWKQFQWRSGVRQAYQTHQLS